MLNQIPISTMASQFRNAGFFIASFSQSGCTYRNPDGRHVYVVTQGAGIVAALTHKDGRIEPLPLEQLAGWLVKPNKTSGTAGSANVGA